jgi:hypothetical protein
MTAVSQRLVGRHLLRQSAISHRAHFVVRRGVGLGDQLSHDCLDCAYTQPNVSGKSEQAGVYRADDKEVKIIKARYHCGND